MNVFKKLQHYFIGDVLSKTDDVFEKVKAEVLVNFTLIFLISNIPYLFTALKSGILMSLAISTLVALSIVLVILKKTNNVKLASAFFLVNFGVQMSVHYIINNGAPTYQGVLFFLLFMLSGYLLMNRTWGLIIFIVVMLFYCLGIYNVNSNFSLFLMPPEMADPAEKGPFLYFAVIPMILNAYLISEFVKAKQKAEKQLSEQKKMIEEKQKEILDSIHYAKRIQTALITGEKYIERNLNSLNKK